MGTGLNPPCGRSERLKIAGVAAFRDVPAASRSMASFYRLAERRDNAMGDSRKCIGNAGAEAAQEPDAAGGENQALQYSPAQTAAYISDLLRELRTLSERSNMPLLSYLLAMAAEEAEIQKNRTSDCKRVVR